MVLMVGKTAILLQMIVQAITLEAMNLRSLSILTVMESGLKVMVYTMVYYADQKMLQ